MTSQGWERLVKEELAADLSKDPGNEKFFSSRKLRTIIVETTNQLVFFFIHTNKPGCAYTRRRMVADFRLRDQG
jgi:hypothetical protein